MFNIMKRNNRFSFTKIGIFLFFQFPLIAAEIKTLRELAVQVILKHNLLWHEELPEAHKKEVAKQVIEREDTVQHELNALKEPVGRWHNRGYNDRLLERVRELRLAQTPPDEYLSHLVHKSPGYADVAACCCVGTCFKLVDIYAHEHSSCAGISLTVVWLGVRFVFFHPLYLPRLVADRLSSPDGWREHVERARSIMQNDAPRPLQMGLVVHEKTD